MVALVTPHDQGFGGPPPPPGGDPVARAAEQVKVPAILLMVMAVIVFLYVVYGLVSTPSAAEIDRAFADAKVPPDGRELVEQAKSFILFLIHPMWKVLPIPASALIFFGGWRMRQVKSWGLSVAASVCAMLPLTACCCCIAGLPVGAWSLVVLMKPEVKAAFQGR
jgi:hypothetical protein